MSSQISTSPSVNGIVFQLILSNICSAWSCTDNIMYSNTKSQKFLVKVNRYIFRVFSLSCSYYIFMFIAMKIIAHYQNDKDTTKI